MGKLIAVVPLLFLVIYAAGCDVIRTECYMGVAGTKASITVKGLLAGQTCKGLLNQKFKIYGIEYRLVELEKAPTEDAFCQLETSGQQFIVRDVQSIFPPTIMGPALCSGLDSYLKPTPSPQ